MVYGVGIALAVLTGLLWGGIGVIVGTIRRHEVNVSHFFTLSSCISAAGSWLVLSTSPASAPPAGRMVELVIICVISGCAGILGMLSMEKAMQAGAVAWAIGQSAMVIPFIAGIFLWQAPFTLPALIILVVMTAGTVLLARGQHLCSSRTLQAGASLHNGPGGSSWLIFALGSFVLFGVQQTVSSLPSAWPDWTDRSGWRSAFTLTASGVFMLILCWRQWLRLGPARILAAKWRWLVGLSVIYACFVVSSQSLLFQAMDRLYDCGLLQMTYPLAISVCMLSVALWDVIVWRRSRPPCYWLGMFLLVSGVFLCASV
ncbi:MAG: hypothetical protein D6820_15805 [Lentisphaerae bacterium]|nr:MAG: hypothetical protein D6820_15805 [Lentisphaerota bacterium]